MCHRIMAETLDEGASAPPELLLVVGTAPDEATARRIAHELVAERLVACVNLVPGLRSIYWWDGEIRDDGEVLMLMKTPRARLALLMERLPTVHPYDVPELLALPIVAGLPQYCDWVARETLAEA
jgi:periplasmic divalent cation tolerance protein